MTDSNHMKHLAALAEEDCQVLAEKERTYGSSWKKRGGVGAFMMLARKWDRLENVCKQHGWDVIEAARKENNFGVFDGSVREQISDLRRYLLLLEAEMVEQFMVGNRDINQATKDAVNREIAQFSEGGRVGPRTGDTVGARASQLFPHAEIIVADDINDRHRV